MFKLVAVTLAALYGILWVFGDEARRPDEVARTEPLGLSVVRAEVLPSSTKPILITGVSDREAVEMAIAAGKTLREERRAAPKAFTVAATSPDVDATEPEPTLDYWYVTGSRVNLRGGPSTSNSVIGQVTFGMEAEVLSDRDGWYEIRLADGSAAGWIFGKFLNDKLPG
ncbi:MAG: SH3 domain-containing protein [Paracoccaceae bacterium]